MGLQTKARFDSLDGEGITTYYDAFGQPTTVLSTMGGAARYVSYYHDDAGNLARLTHADGAAFVYFHDAQGRVTQLIDNPAFTSVDDLVIRYWYKPEGPRHAAVRGAGSGGFTTIYYYDALLRPFVHYNILPDAANNVDIVLGYNAASQIVSRSLSNDAYAAPPASNLARGYQVNGLNQYKGTTYGGAPNWSYEYDANGNLKRAVDPAGPLTTNYVYDVENRLVSASGASNATLVYDPLGRLARVTNGAGAHTDFLYDGDRLIAEYDGAGTMLKRYAHGQGVDEPVAVYDGDSLGLAQRRYMLPDERGSIAALVAADGSPSVRNRYDAWGVPGAGNGGRFQYTGQAYIGELGLYYYKARFYSPTLGRFMQVDPIGYEDQVNLYAYVGNDPINKFDPEGETGYYVSRAAGGTGGAADHGFVVVADYPGGPIKGIYSYTDINGTLRSSTNDLSEDSTLRTDVAVWRSLDTPAAAEIGATFNIIDATDRAIFEAGNAVDATLQSGEVGYAAIPHWSSTGCNSNCGAAAVANLATEASGSPGPHRAPDDSRWAPGRNESDRIEDRVRPRRD